MVSAEHVLDHTATILPRIRPAGADSSTIFSNWNPDVLNSVVID